MGETVSLTRTANVIVSPPIEARKATNTSSPLPGEQLNFTIVVSNGSIIDVPSVRVTDTLPVLLSYANNSLSATSGNPSYGNGTITWNGTLGAHNNVTITFSADVSPSAPIGTSITNSAVISGGGEIITRTASVTVSPNRAYIPLIIRPPKAIVGWVTYNGGAANGIPLQLRFYNGSAWSTAATATTDSTGYFAFVNQPSLAPGQAYYVRYLNSGTSQHLSFWNTRALTSYTSGDYVEIGRFDLANITLTSPSPGATVGLPWTFEWNVRPNTPSDSCEFNLLDLTDGDPWWWTAPLGYRGNYTLNGLPPGFLNNTQYYWLVGVYSPDGGYGMSYYAYAVRLISPESAPRLGSAPLRPKNVLRDLPMPPVRKRP